MKILNFIKTKNHNIAIIGNSKNKEKEIWFLTDDYFYDHSDPSEPSVKYKPGQDASVCEKHLPAYGELNILMKMDMKEFCKLSNSLGYIKNTLLD